jgi:hypothetical protein
MLVRGQALAALGRSREALDALAEAAAAARAEGREAAVRSARLAQAPVLWRLGEKRAAEALLTELAQHHDEARAHLCELLLARRDYDRAAAVVDAIEDAWVRRELAHKLASRR